MSKQNVLVTCSWGKCHNTTWSPDHANPHSHQSQNNVSNVTMPNTKLCSDSIIELKESVSKPTHIKCSVSHRMNDTKVSNVKHKWITAQKAIKYKSVVSDTTESNCEVSQYYNVECSTVKTPPNENM